MHTCQSCDWTGPSTRLNPVTDVFERVQPGEPMPSGECPCCGALCHFKALPPTGTKDAPVRIVVDVTAGLVSCITSTEPVELVVLDHDIKEDRELTGWRSQDSVLPRDKMDSALEDFVDGIDE